MSVVMTSHLYVQWVFAFSEDLLSSVSTIHVLFTRERREILRERLRSMDVYS